VVGFESSAIVDGTDRGSKVAWEADGGPLEQADTNTSTAVINPPRTRLARDLLERLKPRIVCVLTQKLDWRAFGK